MSKKKTYPANKRGDYPTAMCLLTPYLFLRQLKMWSA